MALEPLIVNHDCLLLTAPLALCSFGITCSTFVVRNLGELIIFLQASLEVCRSFKSKQIICDWTPIQKFLLLQLLLLNLTVRFKTMSAKLTLSSLFFAAKKTLN